MVFQRRALVCICQGLIFLFGTFPVLYSQTITSSLQGGKLPCPGEEVIFTCVTRGSPSIAWSSIEYIHPDGDPLQFASVQSVGLIQTPSESFNSDTFVNLTKKFMDGAVQVLESTLRIVISSEFPTFSVSCIHGDGTTRTVSHNLLDDPGLPQNMTSEKRRGEITGRCIVQLSWRPPNNIANNDVVNFTVNINGTKTFSETNNQDKILITTAYHVCSCATHTVSISAVNRCGHAGPSTVIAIAAVSESVPDLRELDCEDCGIMTESMVTNPDEIVNVKPCEMNDVLLAFVVILSAAVLVLIVVLVIVAVKCKQLFDKVNKGESNNSPNKEPKSSKTTKL